MSELKHLKAVVFDWAGTMIDHGSRAPAYVFREIFNRKGISISMDQAREPMGMAKRAHIATISKMPTVRTQWIDTFGAECSEQDIDNMYQQFLPLQKETLKNHSVLIAGAANAAARCRELGLKIGSSTGYTRELMVDVKIAAKEQGYEPDITLCSEDAPRGRPAPYFLYEAAKQLDVYPMSSIVKVDDTILGVKAGVNASCWSIGITRTGNLLGLSQEEVDNLPANELENRIAEIGKECLQAGAHKAIPSVTELEQVLLDTDRAMDEGACPMQHNF